MDVLGFESQGVAVVTFPENLLQAVTGLKFTALENFLERSRRNEAGAKLPNVAQSGPQGSFKCCLTME
jgi:hypothetical protein